MPKPVKLTLNCIGVFLASIFLMLTFGFWTEPLLATFISIYESVSNAINTALLGQDTPHTYDAQPLHFFVKMALSMLFFACTLGMISAYPNDNYVFRKISFGFLVATAATGTAYGLCQKFWDFNFQFIHDLVDTQGSQFPFLYEISAYGLMLLSEMGSLAFVFCLIYGALLFVANMNDFNNDRY